MFNWSLNFIEKYLLSFRAKYERDVLTDPGEGMVLGKTTDCGESLAEWPSWVLTCGLQGFLELFLPKFLKWTPLLPCPVLLLIDYNRKHLSSTAEIFNLYSCFSETLWVMKTLERGNLMSENQPVPSEPFHLGAGSRARVRGGGGAGGWGGTLCGVFCSHLLVRANSFTNPDQSPSPCPLI